MAFFEAKGSDGGQDRRGGYAKSLRHEVLVGEDRVLVRLHERPHEGPHAVVVMSRGGYLELAVRLARYLAHAGVASRRAAERIVAERRVAVAGAVVTDPAFDVNERSGVTLDGQPVAPEDLEVHVLHKPAGVVSTARDTHGRPTVLDLVPSAHRLYPVGRLDSDSTGLILVTNDGELANRLTHPRYGVEKVYLAEVSPRPVDETALRALRNGVELDDGPTLPARVRQTRPGVLEVVLREGRKRQLRRMCEAVGHRVVALRRIAFGPLALGDLAEGQSRRLAEAEVERLRQATGRGKACGSRPPAPSSR